MFAAKKVLVCYFNISLVARQECYTNKVRYRAVSRQLFFTLKVCETVLSYIKLVFCKFCTPSQSETHRTQKLEWNGCNMIHEKERRMKGKLG